MLSLVFSELANTLRSPRTIAFFGVGAAAVGGVMWYQSTRRKPTPEEIERSRRNYLAQAGRIVDGTITDSQWQADDAGSSTGNGEPPHTILYRYRIAGVTYECAQDVSPLLEHVRHVRMDLPVQVRFDPRNPGDSIIVAEGWSGLRVDAAHRAAAPIDNSLESEVGPVVEAR